jgi:hypothetical protein
MTLCRAFGVRRARLTCADLGGRGRYRTADRWCVNPSPTVHRVSRSALASENAQFSGWFASTLSTDCRAVFTCLGTLLAQRGFGRHAFGRVYVADSPGRRGGMTGHVLRVGKTVLSAHPPRPAAYAR